MGAQAERAMRAMEHGAETDGGTAALSRKDTFQLFQQRVEDMLPSVARYLPQMVDPQTLVGVVMLNVRRNPELLECTLDSLLAAALQGMQLNLPPGPFGLAYMVPYYNNKKNTREVEFQVGYKGYIETADRTGRTDAVYAYPVYKGDTFSYTLGARAGNPAGIVHEPDMANDDPQDDAITHVYAVCWKRGSTVPQFVVMTRAQVEAVRKRSQAPNSPAWRNDWRAMALKTAIRRLANSGGMPMSPDLVRVIEADGTAGSVYDTMQPTETALSEPQQPAPQITAAGVETVQEPTATPEPESKAKGKAKGKTKDPELAHTYCPECGQNRTQPADSKQTRCGQCDAELVVAATPEDLRKAVSELFTQEDAKAAESAATETQEDPAGQPSLPME